MASIKFIIKSAKKGSLATVYLRFKNGRDCDITIPTKFKMLPELWLNNTQKFKQRIAYSDFFSENDARNLENKLGDLKNFLNKELNVTTEQTISKKWLVDIVERFELPVLPLKNPVTLNLFLDTFIEEITSGKRLSSKKEKYKPLTIKNFKGFAAQFHLFQEHIKRKYNFNDIDLCFYNDFVDYLVQKKYRPNTIGRLIKQLKCIMGYAELDGLHSNVEIKKRSFKNLSCEVENIYLSEAEIKAMYDLDLSTKPLLEQARDVFLVGCYTAQRFSDYSNIVKDYIRKIDDRYTVIKLTQHKTLETVIIPVRPELLCIFEKYNFELPKMYEQKLNQRIKIVAEMTGINESVELTEIVGGEKRKRIIPKYELVKTHTARRSGCTNMYLAGISTLDIMKISGHKTEREFLKYIKVTKEQTAVNLFNHSYFNNSAI